MEKTLGQIAYESFHSAGEIKSHNFDFTGEFERNAWERAAAAVLDEHAQIQQKNFKDVSIESLVWKFEPCVTTELKG